MEVEKIVSRRRQNQLVEGKAPDFVICTSHDLLPILQAALRLDRGFDDSKSFKSSYKQWAKRSKKGGV